MTDTETHPYVPICFIYPEDVTLKIRLKTRLKTGQKSESYTNCRTQTPPLF